MANAVRVFPVPETTLKTTNPPAQNRLASATNRITGSDAVHTPPGTGSVNVMVEPAHTLPGPKITPALGVLLTVTFSVAETEPQLLETV